MIYFFSVTLSTPVKNPREGGGLDHFLLASEHLFIYRDGDTVYVEAPGQPRTLTPWTNVRFAIEAKETASGEVLSLNGKASAPPETGQAEEQGSTPAWAAEPDAVSFASVTKGPATLADSPKAMKRGRPPKPQQAE